MPRPNFYFTRILRAASMTSLIAGLTLCAASLPGPAVDESRSEKKSETVVVAGGCFWGVEAVFDALKGVSSAVSGYAGGSKANAHYEIVSSGTTGHAESVQITFDPSQISFGQLLKVYFSVVHDPTELNRQGPDEGTQYRSEIFYVSDEQKRVAEAYIQQLTAAKAFRRPIVTKVAPLQAFYPAEDYHQHFVAKNPHQAYVAYNDLPKLTNLRAEFPELLKGGK
jgi:peptide-methionine (S)-S-oxide reductase